MMSSSNLGFPAPQLDLSGKLIIKARLGDDIRQIPIHNEDITYDELLLMMQRLFRGRIKGSDDIVIKYKDSDGDLITIFDSSDLSFAKSLNRHLKVTLFVNGKPKPLESDQVKDLRNELISIRDTVNDLLNRLQSYSDNAPVHSITTVEDRNSLSAPGKDTEKPVAKVPGSMINQMQVNSVDTNKASAAMFDPLKNEADSTSQRKDPFTAIGQSQHQTAIKPNPPIHDTSTSYQPQANLPSTQQPNQQPTYPSSVAQAPANQYQSDQAIGGSSVAALPVVSDNTASVQPYSNQQQQQQQQGNFYETNNTGYQQPSYQQQQQQQQQAQAVGYASQGGQPQQSNSFYNNQPATAYSQETQIHQVQQPSYNQQSNPYRTMSPRQQYPTPSQGYDIYYQSQGGTQPPVAASVHSGYTGLPG